MSSILEINNLKFSWPRSQNDLLNIKHLELKKGASLFLHGPSGSGKSTLLNLIGCVLQPQSGEISILESKTSNFSLSQKDKFRADHMGFIFQRFNLLPYLSAVENILLSCHFSKVKTQRALSTSRSLGDEASRLLHELKLDVKSLHNKNVTQLSVGQQQRVAAARALIGKPELIIADEPTSALDTSTQEHFLELLFKECRASGASLVFVSHNLKLGDQFDQQISLNDINLAPTTSAQENFAC